MTLEYDILTLNMSSDAVENDIIEHIILKSPYMDPEIISLALLEVTLAQDSVTPSDSRLTNLEHWGF